MANDLTIYVTKCQEFCVMEDTPELRDAKFSAALAAHKAHDDIIVDSYTFEAAVPYGTAYCGKIFYYLKKEY